MATQVKITPNWMSTVDSPTYKLTLYLVHPSVWNNPNTLASLEVPRDSTGQPLAVVIAESGATSTYALDNLSIISYVTRVAQVVIQSVVYFNSICMRYWDLNF